MCLSTMKNEEVLRHARYRRSFTVLSGRPNVGTHIGSRDRRASSEATHARAPSGLENQSRPSGRLTTYVELSESSFIVASSKQLCVVGWTCDICQSIILVNLSEVRLQCHYKSSLLRTKRTEESPNLCMKCFVFITYPTTREGLEQFRSAQKRRLQHQRDCFVEILDI